MKKILLVAVLMMLAVSCSAETGFKSGIGLSKMNCMALENTVVFDTYYYQNRKYWGNDFGVSFSRPAIKQVDDLYMLNYYLNLKGIYRCLELGFGVGYLDNYMKRQYDVDKEWERHAFLRIKRGNYEFEIKFVDADLDIETGLPYTPPVEQSSNLRRWEFKINRKW